jgi:hypothetical protein
MKELMGGRHGTHEGNGAVSDLAASSEDMPRSGSGNGAGVRIEHPNRMAETKRVESITATVFMTGISDVRLLPGATHEAIEVLRHEAIEVLR